MKASEGRDFLMTKHWDVGEFEADLRNVQNAYKKLENTRIQLQTADGTSQVKQNYQ